MTVPDNGFRGALTYPIPAGATGLGGVADLGGYRLSALVLPSTWISAALSFQVLDPVSAEFYELQDDTRTAISISAGLTGAIALVGNVATALWPFRYLKIRSGLAGAAVNQTAGPTITLLLDPIG